MSISERLRKHIGTFVLIFICALIASIPLWASIIRGDEVDRYFENSTTGEIVERLDEVLLYEHLIEYEFEFPQEVRLCQHCNTLYNIDFDSGTNDYCEDCIRNYELTKWCSVCGEGISLDYLSKFKCNGETYYICAGCASDYIKNNTDFQEYVIEKYKNW